MSAVVPFPSDSEKHKKKMVQDEDVKLSCSGASISGYETVGLLTVMILVVVESSED